MDAPLIHVPFPQGATLSEMLTSLRDFGLAYPEQRANIIQHCADLQNWFSEQLISAGNSRSN
jgi:hypothetical protein